MIGFVMQPENSAFSFGMGVFAVAGFGVNYAGQTTNFPLTPPPPAGLGFGPIFSQFQVLQIAPALSYRITDRLSIGGGPTLNMASLQASPGILSPPDDANGNGFASYPGATHSETTWGGGFNAGIYYQADTWSLGASYKSTQWFDDFRFNSSDELGRPRKLNAPLQLPSIVSIGTAYTGLERFTFGADLRYIDYANVQTLGDKGFTANGAVLGAGWRSIFALALGSQYQLNSAVSLRLGYTWNGNPIPDKQSFVNTASPVLIQNTIYTGATWNISDNVALSASYAHGFENSIRGPLVTPAGSVPYATVTNLTSADLAMFAVSVKLGGCGR